MSDWYYVKNGQQQGPLDFGQLKQLAQKGVVRADDLVWTQSMAHWQEASQVESLAFIYSGRPFSAAPAPATAPPQRYEHIQNYLPWAIASTICCCLPGGIVAIVYAAQASTAERAGEYGRAQDAAGKAKMWIIISVIFGALFSIFWLIVQLTVVDGTVPGQP